MAKQDLPTATWDNEGNKPGRLVGVHTSRGVVKLDCVQVYRELMHLQNAHDSSKGDSAKLEKRLHADRRRAFCRAVDHGHETRLTAPLSENTIMLSDLLALQTALNVWMCQLVEWAA